MSDTYQAENAAPPSEAAPITGNPEEMIRESVSELNKKREHEGTLGDPGEPIERRWGDDSDKPVTLKDAARAFSEQHKFESGKAHLASLSEVERRQVVALGSDPDSDQFALEVGDLAAQLGKKPSEAPLDKIGVAGNSGKVHAPLDDMSAIIGDRAVTQPATGNLREVTRGVTSFREAEALRQQQLLAELQAAQVAAEQAAGGQEATPPQRPAQQPQPAVQPPQPQLPAQQPDPVAVERQQLAWQRQVNAELAQLPPARRKRGRASTIWRRNGSRSPRFETQESPGIRL